MVEHFPQIPVSEAKATKKSHNLKWVAPGDAESVVDQPRLRRRKTLIPNPYRLTMLALL